MSPPVQEPPTAYKSVHLYRLPLRGRRGDACERRLWRRKRARRSGRIKATDKWALPTQTEPLIQQDMSPPYRGADSFIYIFCDVHRSFRIASMIPAAEILGAVKKVSAV